MYICIHISIHHFNGFFFQTLPFQIREDVLLLTCNACFLGLTTLFAHLAHQHVTGVVMGKPRLQMGMSENVGYYMVNDG